MSLESARRRQHEKIAEGKGYTELQTRNIEDRLLTAPESVEDCELSAIAYYRGLQVYDEALRICDQARYPVAPTPEPTQTIVDVRAAHQAWNRQTKSLIAKQPPVATRDIAYNGASFRKAIEHFVANHEALTLADCQQLALASEDLGKTAVLMMEKKWPDEPRDYRPITKHEFEQMSLVDHLVSGGVRLTIAHLAAENATLKQRVTALEQLKRKTMTVVRDAEGRVSGTIEGETLTSPSRDDVQTLESRTIGKVSALAAQVRQQAAKIRELEARPQILESRIKALEAKPQMKYEGVWKAGQRYAAGSVVTESGSLWVAKLDGLESRPGLDHIGWQLCVKRGRDGKDGRDVRSVARESEAVVS